MLDLPRVHKSHLKSTQQYAATKVDIRRDLANNVIDNVTNNVTQRHENREKLKPNTCGEAQIKLCACLEEVEQEGEDEGGGRGDQEKGRR